MAHPVHLTVWDNTHGQTGWFTKYTISV